MSNDKENEKVHSVYDGIVELDNSLPGWWLGLFYICVIWGAGYWVYYQLAGGNNQVQELALDMEEVNARKEKAASTSGGDATQTDLSALVGNEAAITAGNKEYQSKCASCHGKLGEGGIGPNLTDNFWLHGDGSIGTIVTTITEGVPAKGMPPWGPVIPANKISEVAAYIVSLKGSNPANQKAPQGNEIK